MTIAALGGIGALASAGGALYSGIANSEAASYQAQVAQNNATIANQNATRAIAAGQQQAQNQSLKNAEQAGAIKTALAANNVDVNSGSNLDVQASRRATNQLDTENTLYNAQETAYGYRVNAVSDEAQSQLDQATAENAIPGAVLGASGSLLANDKFTSWIIGTDKSSGGGGSGSGGNPLSGGTLLY